MKTAKYSERDTKGKLYIDCIECKRGINGTEKNKCASGMKTKKPYIGGCFGGELLDGLYVPENDVDSNTKKQ